VAPVSTILGRLKAAWALAFEAFQEWVRDRCDGLAAAMTFDAILAIAPFLVVILRLAARLFGQEWMRRQILPVMLGWIGPRGTAVLEMLLAQTEKMEPQAAFTLGVLGTIGLALGASGYFTRLQDALQTVWGVRRDEAGIRVQMRKRIRGLLYAVASASILLAGLTAAALVLSLGPDTDLHSSPHGIRWAAEAAIVFLTFWILMTFWLKCLPPVRLPWRQILPWTAFMAMLHLLGRLILNRYVASLNSAGDVSVAGSFFLVFLWLYYAGNVFLYGAELMRVYLQRHGVVRPV
jgi:membrane protein